MRGGLILQQLVFLMNRGGATEKQVTISEGKNVNKRQYLDFKKKKIMLLLTTFSWWSCGGSLRLVRIFRQDMTGNFIIRRDLLNWTQRKKQCWRRHTFFNKWWCIVSVRELWRKHCQYITANHLIHGFIWTSKKKKSCCC